ncbi:DUF488 domain-containing protein [Chitinophagaceae bacterium MMS25-I14]
MIIKTKRIYASYAPADGFRVLTDRLWPRGMKKEEAHFDKWAKEIAPSAELRKWLDHDPGKWEEFKKKYYAELKDSDAFKDFISLLQEHKTMTLLFGAKEEKYNQAVALKEFLEKL